MMNVQQLASRLIEEVPGVGPNESRKRISRAIKENCEAHPWQHLVARAQIETEPSYGTGTLAVTQGSNAVVLTGGTWLTAWSVAPSFRRITIQGRPEPIDITITGATTGTLAYNWLGATKTAATYKLYRDIYPLPADCDYGKVLTLFDVQFAAKMAFRDYPFFLIRKTSVQGSVGTPVEFALVQMTAEQPPRPQIEFGFEAPSTDSIYFLWYFKRPAFPSAGTDYPNFPERFENLHWLRAAIAIGSSARTPNKNLPLWQRQFDDLMLMAKAEMDGGAVVDREVQSVFLGRRSNLYAGPGAGGSPDFQNNWRFLG